jgi:tetratricopeptide (TPR) repeat protein
LADFAAVSLFVERARQGWAAFTLSPQNSLAVVRLCQLVEGMPLGLELLASQIRGFMPEHIIQAIEDNLACLQTDLRTVPARHRSLQSVFEWSWSLLFPTQRHLLSHLSVFRGGFEFEAAQAVVGVAWPDLLELWDRALLRRHPSGRWEMHELLKQFAQEKLALYEAPHSSELVQDRHSYYYMTLVSHWEVDILNEDPKQAMAECRRELDNIRQAWQWAVNQKRFEWITRGLTSIVSIYDLLGLFQEAIAILEAATARVKAHEATTANPAEAEMLQNLWGRLLVEQSHFLYEQARHDRLAEIGQTLIGLGERTGLVALTAAGYLQWGKARLGQGQYEGGQQDLEQALVLAQQAQLPRLVADSLYFLGITSQYQGQRPQARHYFEQALAHYHQQAHPQGEEDAQSWLVTFATNQDYAQSKAYFEQRLTVARQRANPINQARLLHLLARLCIKLGQYHQAKVYEEESWRLAQSLHRPWFVATRLNWLSIITYYLKEYDLALQYGYQALAAAKALKSPLLEGSNLTALGHILLAQGELSGAARIYEQALALHRAQNNPEAAMETLAGLAGVALARHALSQAQTYAEEILVYLEENDLERLDEPFFISLTCYRVLQAGQDPQSKSILSRAYALLQVQAARLSDETLRRSFLEQVVVNREIVSLYHLF